MGVLFKNTDITIYNIYTSGGVSKWQRTVIKDVNWQGTRNATIGTSGLLVAYSVFLFIKKLDNYLPSRQFKLLSDVDRPKYFTFSLTDKIVKGATTLEITRTDVLPKTFDDVITIIGISDLHSHFEVEGT